MSDEKRLKDLLARLVAMSPEPPPFPEEVQMASHETKRSPRPILVFAGAAALVIALAVPLLLFFRGSGPETVATTVPAPVTSTSVPQESTSTSTSETTVTTVAPISTWSQSLFLFQTPEDSFLGNPALVPVRVDVTDMTGAISPEAPFTEVLATVSPDLPEPYFNAIPPEVQILSLALTDGAGGQTWVADMNEAFLEGAGGLLADVSMLNQLVYTITEETSVDRVTFTVNGEPIEAYGTEGIVLTDPVSRETYIDELALIFVTQPIMEDEFTYIVAGRANTFEGSLSVRVLDESGAIIHEEPTQASCGSGCWGGFGVGIGKDLIEPGSSSIQLLDYSAEDGSPQNIITIPIPEDNIWVFTIGE